MNWRYMRIAILFLASMGAASVPALTLAPAQAEEQQIQRQLPVNREGIELSYAPLVKQTTPAVVNVYAARQVRAASPFAGDPFFEQFFGNQLSGPPRIQQSLGSGVIVDPSGLIVTNYHVIKDADEVKVALSDGREFESKILLRDKTTDLVVLKINAKDKLPVLPFANSDKVEVGDLVLAIGNPFGVGQTVTSGIVSAQSRTQVGISDFDFFIQTDAAINPGNSGGALIDMRGRLIGLNTAIYSRSGGSVGIGFAIPSNMVRAVVEAARRGATSFDRPYIGATFQGVTPDLAESLGMDKPAGTLVTAIQKDSPAEAAGLKVGDVILSAQGVPTGNPDVLGYRLSTAGIGSTVPLEVLRDGKTRTIPVTLAKAPAVRQSTPQLIEGNSPLSGATVVELTPAIAEQLDLNRAARGVVVGDVKDDSLAAQTGLRPGDIVRSVNGKAINTVNDLSAVLKAGRGIAWRLGIERNGTLMRLFIR